MKTDADVVIAGGGLAGLATSILLARRKKRVIVLEKKEYPFHKVCGEYVSNEVLGLLRSLGFDPFEHGATRISRLRISTHSGRSFRLPLDLGGFGLSRYTMDHALAQLAEAHGVQVITGARVTDIYFEDDTFYVKTNSSEVYAAKLVVCSYGKRDMLDKKLDRKFIHQHTGYLAVKYHLQTDYPPDEIGLDNFPGGYSGIVKIEKDRYNVCYLYRRRPGDHVYSIRDLEENVLFRNPVIRKIFENADRLFPQPEAINEISFAPKTCVEDHLLMCGDSAGLITPLCGNGMSMALHGAKLLTDSIISSGILDLSYVTMEERMIMEARYAAAWKRQFSRRLFFGRALQHLFGNSFFPGLSLRSMESIPSLARFVISGTHGKPLLAR